MEYVVRKFENNVSGVWKLLVKQAQEAKLSEEDRIKLQEIVSKHKPTKEDKAFVAALVADSD